MNKTTTEVTLKVKLIFEGSHVEAFSKQLEELVEDAIDAEMYESFEIEGWKGYVDKVRVKKFKVTTDVASS